VVATIDDGLDVVTDNEEEEEDEEKEEDDVEDLGDDEP